MAEQESNSITPAICVYHDAKNYNIEVELPGVEKRDIDFEMSENWFCLKAPKKDESYAGCWVLAHDIKPEEAKAKFENGLLSVSVPLEEIATKS
ncbi:MAG TPA: Hsp20/alpha crystallin family protein [Methanobacterium sp.]